MDRINTLLLDSNALFREGLARILEGTNFVVTKEIKPPELDQALKEVDRPPQLVIADLGDSPDRDLAPLSELRAAFPSTKIVVLTGSQSPELLARALKAGVDGYLHKEISVEAFTRCLQIVVMGLQVFPTSVRMTADLAGAEPEAPSRPREDHPSIALSDRESQILQCLVEGYSNKAIARELDIAEATVKVYVKGLLRKIHANNRTQAAVWALSRDVRKRSGPARAPAPVGANGAEHKIGAVAGGGSLFTAP